MNKLKTIIAFIGVIVKYSAIVLAVIKGIQCTYNELQDIDFEKSIKSENE